MRHFQYVTCCILILLSINISSFAQCEHPDYDALMELYDATNGQIWLESYGWQEGKDGESCDPCDFNGTSWFGVFCSEGRVVELFLDVNNLSGALPDLQLEELLWLGLFGNTIHGSLPDFTGMPNLMYLECSFNRFNGTIPNFSNLPILTEFWGFGNQFTGTIPDFNNCQDLYFLDLSSNMLNGIAPKYSLQNLTDCYLIGNQIEGNFPDITECPNLTFLDISLNKLSGNFPDLGAHPFKENLNIFLGENELSGCYPESICELGHVELFGNSDLPYFGEYFVFCDGESQIGAECASKDLGVYGTIDENCACTSEPCFQEHPDLEMLLNFYEALDGDNWIDNFGWKAGALGYACDPCVSFEALPWSGLTCDGDGRVICIDMDGVGNCSFDGFEGNNLNGILPVLEFDRLHTLILDGNNIIGNIPDLSGMPNLENFRARFCNFSGPLPDFDNLENLKEFRVSFNALTGEIPDLSGAKNLSVFTAARNELVGCYPDDVCDLDLFETNGNIAMPWEGRFFKVCEGEEEIGAPCSNGNLGQTSIIDENCNCTLLSSILNSDNNALQVYPNPTTDKLYISDCSNCNNYQIQNIHGSTIGEGAVLENSVNISELSSGTYFLRIEQNSGEDKIVRFLKL